MVRFGSYFSVFGLLICLVVLTLSSPTRAQISSDFGGANGGAVVIGESTTTCDSSIEGAIRYNSAEPCVQFCDGSNWACTGVGPNDIFCDAPTLCPVVGDVCDDGNGGNDPDPKFGGFLMYDNATCEPLFVQQADEAVDQEWKTTAGADDITTDSMEDGKINDSQVSNSTTFPAFKACKDLVYGGFSDWYLPAVDELYLLWKNSAAIGGFSADDYWSSSEVDVDDAWKADFDDGETNNRSKISQLRVRCIRRD